MDPFVEAHRPQWERLDALLGAASEGSLRALSPPELGELGRLYRQAATHLAQARAERRDPRLVEYLNLLVGRGHALIYSRQRRRRFRIGRFFAAEFPQTFRRSFPFTAASTVLSVAAAVLAYGLVMSDRGWVDHVAPRQLEDAVEEFLDTKQPAGAYFGETQAAFGSAPFSALLWTHNLQVGVTAFAGGISFGLLTVWALVTNGMMVGSFLAVGALQQRQADCWAIIAPHGFLELSAIFICGGAGLMVGYSLIDPGDLRRRDALVVAAREAVKLVLGTAPMFLVAGCVEGTLSPISTGVFAHDWARIAFGLGVWAIFAGYVTAGDSLIAHVRRRRAKPRAEAARRLRPSLAPGPKESR
jgi:uncharacterized membrane protein SpoIIM required for sporulation